MFAGVMTATSIAQDETKPPVRNPNWPGTPQGPMQPDIPSSFAKSVAERVAGAHNVRAWRAHDAFTCNITINFGGQTMLEGSMTVDTNNDRVRFDLNNGIKLVWDGEKAWVSPADAQVESPRFHLRTWSTFLKLPFDTDKPGTHVKDETAVTMDHQVFNAFRVTFDESSGRDTPNDWILGMSDIVTHTLQGAAYISTWGGKSIEDAEREPHILMYEEPAILNGVVIARTWSIFHWSESRGRYGEKVGEVTLRDVSFTQIRETTFARPENGREVAAPAAGDDEKKKGEEPADS